MLKKLCLTALMIMLLAALVFGGCAKPAPTTPAPTTPGTPSPTPAPAEKIELRWLYDSTGAPAEGTHFYPMWSRFRDEVRQNTGGRVTHLDLVGSVTGPDMYDSLIAGTGDICFQVIMVNAGRFPILEMANVVDYFSHCERPSAVFRDLYNEFPEIQNELSEAKVLTCFGTPPSPPGVGFGTRDKPVRTLEDAKGMKLGQYGEWGTKEVAALGFTPVAVPPWEVYEAIQKGLVDGSNMDIAFLTTQNVGEVIKYWHGISFIYCPFYLSMNWDTWNKLPPDVQKVISEAALKVPDNSDWGQEQYVSTILPAWPNVSVVEIAPDEQVRWKATQDPIQQEYMNMIKAKGVDGQKIFDRLNELLAKYAEPLPSDPNP